MFFKPITATVITQFKVLPQSCGLRCFPFDENWRVKFTTVGGGQVCEKNKSIFESQNLKLNVYPMIKN